MALELPPGTQLSDTEKVTEDVARVIRGLPEVRSVFVDGGRVPTGTHRVAPRLVHRQPTSPRPTAP